jgi:hypothetical protein
MKTKVTLLIVLFGALLVGGWAFQQPNPPRQQWEYKTIVLSAMRAEPELALHGAQGWELIEFKPEGNSTNLYGLYIFKRPR